MKSTRDQKIGGAEIIPFNIVLLSCLKKVEDISYICIKVGRSIFGTSQLPSIGSFLKVEKLPPTKILIIIVDIVRTDVHKFLKPSPPLPFDLEAPRNNWAWTMCAIILWLTLSYLKFSIDSNEVLTTLLYGIFERNQTFFTSLFSNIKVMLFFMAWLFLL